ncbi:BgTH12-01943, partial [Blumeria graminis f. sp. triticale]
LVVAGSSGGIGQPLSLLLKTCPLISELVLYDILNTPGWAADLSHIPSTAKVTAFLPERGGERAAYEGAEIVIVPAGIPRKPGMDRDNLFSINASIVKSIIELVAEVAPKAYILIISNPVNSTVPIAAEALKSKGVFDPRRLFGITTLDVVRAQTFAAEITGEKNPLNITIPVVGGHSGETIVPLFSQANPSISIESTKLAELVKRVQFGGDEVVKAKEGSGSATLSMAYAAFRFTESLLKALGGEEGIVEPSFVYLPGITGGAEIQKEVGVDFFSVPIELSTNGAEKIQDPISNATDDEKNLIKAAIGGLKENIEKGITFFHTPQSEFL